MKVKVANRIYRIGKKEYEGLLKMASEMVPKGIYAVEQGDYAELRNDHAESNTHLKKMIRDYRAAGFKVMYNRG